MESRVPAAVGTRDQRALDVRAPVGNAVEVDALQVPLAGAIVPAALDIEVVGGDRETGYGGDSLTLELHRYLRFADDAGFLAPAKRRGQQFGAGDVGLDIEAAAVVGEDSIIDFGVELAAYEFLGERAQIRIQVRELPRIGDPSPDVIAAAEFALVIEILAPHQRRRDSADVDRAGQIHAFLVDADIQFPVADVASQHRLGGGNAGDL
ncbi:MAG: hypothetical protein HYS64_07200 [Rhodospirillales bacterium]|nr:hypothetical protein [Rhodospirillales bacterium]